MDLSFVLPCGKTQWQSKHWNSKFSVCCWSKLQIYEKGLEKALVSKWQLKRRQYFRVAAAEGRGCISILNSGSILGWIISLQHFFEPLSFDIHEHSDFPLFSLSLFFFSPTHQVLCWQTLGVKGIRSAGCTSHFGSALFCSPLQGSRSSVSRDCPSFPTSSFRPSHLYSADHLLILMLHLCPCLPLSLYSSFLEGAPHCGAIHSLSSCTKCFCSQRPGGLSPDTALNTGVVTG